MTLAVSIILISAVLAFVLFIRPGAIPPNETLSPTAHLEERREAIHENLRDLNFEYRLGKLSDDDYEKTKLGLHNELAKVMAGIESIAGKKARPAPAAAQPEMKAGPAKPVYRCPACGAGFDKPMKFCGECAAPMGEAQS
ncbi:MAG: hypothetical protein C0504_02965 [Candidatus Solibacter sp.]|nr:hypothetical protein [Candidatus Solibacter sp.]